ncbi:Uncharacterised protein (plasmid) [Tsukamurella tyrosinosolvens]|uniref:Uncharacterized protein n=1 Tax=Tsukamurella tyrosinosolvens TaxID=57704 RepID=A0A1H4U285_TSUTY|nr:hypothetical protein [Tsukamurella tyrosinosolvens]KXO93034.1 hypothetical protein AXK58_14280 [Tsukamurella tyrosinosolvens]SEC62812.1 hypothetical protein SAMN04489793_2773 [Tsukamurella tyrosinosolvens]VEH93972.1 Uncharacterised protein [Tsukamurella tyrosinosolvens]
MAHATNRTEMLAKALKRAREDFSLHNARAFARSVIEAPPDVFAAKPLTFLPLDQSNSTPWRAAAEAAAPFDPTVQTPGRFAPSSRYLVEKYGTGDGYGVDGSTSEPDPQRAADSGAALPETDFASRVASLFTPPRPGDILLGYGNAEVAVVMDEHRAYGRDGREFSLARDVHYLTRRYDVREVDPLTAIGDATLAWVSVLAQLTDLCGWAPDSPEAQLLDSMLRPEYRQPRGITTLAELVDHMLNSGSERHRSMHDRIRFQVTDPSPLVDRTGDAPTPVGFSGHRVDFPDAESARLAAEIATIGTEPVPDGVIFRRRGQEVAADGARPGDMVHNGESNRMIGVVTAVHPDGSKDMVTGPQSLPIMLALTEDAPPVESAGIPLNAGGERRVPVSPAEARQGDILVAGGTAYLVLDSGKVLAPDTGAVIPMDRTPEMTGSDDGFFRVAGNGPAAEGGEWARFVEMLPAGYTPVVSTGVQSLDPLKLLEPPKFPQLSAESEDQIDVPALVREMGGSPQAGELLDRVVPMSMMSRALVSAISSGAVTLHVDRTVTLPEPSPDPRLGLPASADRPPIVRRDASDAGKLWKDTRFHVGFGTDGLVMWSPAEAGSMLVTGRTGSGLSVFVEGAITDALGSGWEVVSLDRHLDTDTYAAAITDAHKLSSRRAAGSTPILVVLDEFQAFSRAFASENSKAEVTKLSGQVLDMLKFARTSRVHLVLVTHDLHAQTIPSAWLPHFGAAVVMGAPSDLARHKLGGGAKIPAEAFPRGVRGRGVFFARPGSGTYEVVQTYLPSNEMGSLSSMFGDEISTLDPELTRKFAADHPRRPLTPHEFIAGINGGPKLLDIVNQMPAQAPVVGQALNALLGLPAGHDQSKPNHYYWDSLGDPLACTEDHNHPDPDDEPRGNVAIRAEHELADLPQPVDRPVVRRGGTRIKPAAITAFSLGHGPGGQKVTYTPAEDGPLRIHGGPGRGKTMLAQGLLRDAAAAGWDTAYLSWLAHFDDPDEATRQFEQWRKSGISGRVTPLLLALDHIEHLDDRPELAASIRVLLRTGTATGTHLVVIEPESDRTADDLWAGLAPATLLTGAPTAEEASGLLGDASDLLPRAGWEGSGKMVLMRAADEDGVRAVPEPLRAYIESRPDRSVRRRLT